MESRRRGDGEDTTAEDDGPDSGRGAEPDGSGAAAHGGDQTASLGGTMRARFVTWVWDRVCEPILEGIRDAVVRAATGAWNWAREHPQLVLGVLLVIVVPVASIVAYERWIDPDPAPTPPPPPSPVPEDELEVMVIWSGGELDDFRDVASEYPNGPVRVRPVGRDIGKHLDQRFREDNPPDVAIIAQPSLVWRYAREGQLHPVSDDVAARFPPQWQSFTRVVLGGETPDQALAYGAFVKGAHKSLLWYQPGALDVVVPEAWTATQMFDWLNDQVLQPSFDAPLTLAAGDAWPLTDMFEANLAARDPVLYNRLAVQCETSWDHEAVRQALSDTATMWGIEGVFYGGPEGVSGYEWSELARQVGGGHAGIAFAPSFLAGPVESLAVEDQPRPFGFPAVDGVRPQVVGGDIAVVPRQTDSSQVERAADFVDWLTRRDAITRWAEEDPGYLTPNVESPYQPDAEPPLAPEEDVRVWLTWYLTNPPQEELLFDLSDQFGVVSEGDPRATWDIFVDFFQDVTSGRSVSEASDEVIAQLNEVARSSEWDPQVDC